MNKKSLDKKEKVFINNKKGKVMKKEEKLKRGIVPMIHEAKTGKNPECKICLTLIEKGEIKVWLWGNGSNPWYCCAKCFEMKIQQFEKLK